MFSKNIKSILIITLIFVMSLISVVLNADCDMMAMIAKEGHYVSWRNSSYDLFDFIRDRSTNTSPFIPFVNDYKNNDDGYGFIYYPDDGTFDVNDQAWYQTDPTSNSNTFYTDDGLPSWNPLWQDALDDAEEFIMLDNTKASIVFGHARQGSVGEGSHPFYFDYNGKTYTLIHNGTLSNDLKTPMYTYLYNLNLLNNSNWGANPANITTWIDSEIFFLYLMSFIDDNNGNVTAGIHDALTQTNLPGVANSNIKNMLQNPVTYLGNTYKRIANIILSDGENLYVFRNSPSVGSTYPDLDPFHNLSYEENNSIITVKTLDDLDTRVDQFDFVIIPKYGDPYEIPSFLNQPHSYFISTDITSNVTWNDYKFISSDITISNNAEITLSDNAKLILIGHSNLTIENATVNISNNAQLQLYNASQVLIENDGILFLDWGSTITGSTPTTVAATIPGHSVGGEPLIPGDRIIAKNGGIITADDDYLSPGAEITIETSSGNQWDGIYIQNPGDDDGFWFVNCDISGIRKLSIENVGLNARNIAKLNLHQTDFHDAGQIVVRDGHELTVHGNVDESEYCYFENTPAYPIVTYESPVDLDYVNIEDNGGGIYLYEASSTTSTIKNCNINYNNGDGVKPNGVTFSEFSNNYIEENTGFGMLCYDGTLFTGFYPFNNVTINDNGFAEYAGWHDTFEMEDTDANISISDGDYGSGSDQYLLMNLKWDPTESVDISGTNITNDSHLYPQNPDPPATQAWIFSQGGITGSKQLLNTASIDFTNEDYDSAQQTLYQLLDEYLYSKEAVTAVYYLYHIESLSTEDFAGLRDYLLALTVDEDTHIYDTIKKVSAKTLMKEKDYVSAIIELEDIIINSDLPDEVISAMIDEGYCYLKLSESGDRALPENCTIKTATLDEYQARVREMEMQYTFYPEEQNQNTTPIPGNIVMHSNHPNPFNPSTTISFDLAQASMVSVDVYNIKGQKVRTLLNEYRENGTHSIVWNGKDRSNKSVASGLYFYKLTSGKDTVTHKMLLLK